MYDLNNIVKMNNSDDIPRLSDSYIYKINVLEDNNKKTFSGYVHLMDTNTIVIKTRRNSADLIHINKSDVVSIYYSNKLYGDLIWERKDD